MNIFTCILIVIIVFIVINCVLYKGNVKSLTTNNINIEEHTLLEQYYFQNYIDIQNSKKKKIFIHMSYEANQRNWSDFYGRTSNDMNLDICVLCVKSVIYHCSSKYDVVLYNNNNVKELLQEENKEDLCNIENPNILSGVDLLQWENYCKAKLIYKYGGIAMEPYFFFYKCPDQRVLFPNSFTVLNHVNEGLNVSSNTLIPSSNYFMSCPAKNSDMNLYLTYLEYLCVHQYSLDHKHFDKTFEKLYALSQYEPKYMGIMDINNKPIESRDLLAQKDILLDSNAYCLFVNVPFFKKYTQHGYFLKMNRKQIKESHTFIGEFIRQYS